MRRRLIVNADDFGRSRSINAAVVRAHREGILTTASLMVTGEAAEEAVELAGQHPGLGVGLHLVLVRGRSAVGAGAVPGLTGASGAFGENPVAVGMRYFFRPGLRAALEREIEAQVGRFRATGLRLDHVNGHLHFHLHPVVIAILLRRAAEWGLRAIRLTRDPLLLNLRLARGRTGYRLVHWGVFRGLSAWCGVGVRRAGLRHTERVFGLLQDGRVDGAFVSRLVDELPRGDSELYCHPSLEEFSHELEALTAPGLRDRLRARGIELIRYADL